MTQSAEVGPYVRGADEGEALWFLGSLMTMKVTGAETRGRLTVADVVNPPGFAPPLHRHLDEDEMFYVLSGTVEFRCEGQTFSARAGDFVMLPVGLAHTFLVGREEPLRTLQITTPSGFERFAAEVGQPAQARRLPDPGPIDPEALGRAAARNAIELLGPPPQH